MKYYKNVVTGEVFAFNADGSQDYLITKDMVELFGEALEQHLNPPLPPEIVEQVWLAEELETVATQLLLIEDGDPSALFGTDRQWRDYRIALRGWKEGAVGFPEIEQRPSRPS